METMNNFAELQKLWSRKGVDDTIASTGESFSDSLVERLRSFETNQNRINRFKLVVVVSICISIIYTLILFKVDSLVSFLGLAVMLASILAFMLYYFKHQFNINRLDFTSNSYKFVNMAIGMLNRQIAIFRRPFVYFILTIILGFNIFCLGIPNNSGFLEIAYLHIASSVFIALSAYLGLKIREWRTKREIAPLLEELNSVMNNLASEQND